MFPTAGATLCCILAIVMFKMLTTQSFRRLPDGPVGRPTITGCCCSWCSRVVVGVGAAEQSERCVFDSFASSGMMEDPRALPTKSAPRHKNVIRTCFPANSLELRGGRLPLKVHRGEGKEAT